MDMTIIIEQSITDSGNIGMRTFKLVSQHYRAWLDFKDV